MSNDTNSSALCFLSGLALVAMGYSLHSHYEYLQEQQQSTKIKLRKGKLKKGERLEDAIPLKSLAYLIQSNNASIQNNSVEIIIGRAMSKETLSYIITTCQKDQPIELRSKALTALQLLTQKKKHRPTLLEQGALGVLVEALASNEEEMKEITQRNVAMAICDLIQENDINKYCVIEMGILDSIQRILTSTTIKNNELKYWTLMILHQISLSEPFPKVLVHQGFVGLLAKMARMTFGNTNMPKFCMQSLVRLVASVDTIESKTVLIELLDYNIVDLISICLRADDVELIYWAAGLMHEFVLKDVASDQFRSIQGIHTILAGLLSADEMYISRVILRTVKFMAYGHESFRQGMVKTNIVKKIMHCLSLEDDDVRYWAILCIHAVAGQVESHSDILNAPEFKILLELAVSRKVHAALFVADILSLICCIWQNDIAMEKHIELLATTLEDLLTWNEVEVQYNSAGAIFNLVSMRNSFAAVVKEKCIDGILSLSIYSAHERVQLTSAKTSLSLTIKYPSLKPKLISEVVEPLINTCITINRPFIPLIVMQIIANTTDQSDSTKMSSNTMLEEDEVFTPNYVNVNPNGAISSEYRLGRLLQGAQQQQQNNNLFNQSQRNINRRRNRQRRRRRRRNQRVALLEQFSTTSNSSLNDDDTDVNEEDDEAHEGGNRNREIDGDDGDDDDDEDDDDYDEEYVKKTKLTGSELLSNLSLFFEQSLNDRIQILKDFQLPTTVHTQLSGSLCALRHLLENDKIMDDVISGAFFQSSTTTSATTTTSNCVTTRTPSSLQEQIRYILSSDDEDDFTTFGMDDIDDDNEVEDQVQIDDTYNYKKKEKKKIGETSSNYTSKPVCCDHKNYPLTDKVRQLVDSLIYQSLFPIIGQWWEAIGHQQHDIEKICMNEENAIQVYHDVLNWIHMITCLTTQQHSNYYYEASLPNSSSTTTANIPNINTFHSEFEWGPYDDEKNNNNATTNEKKSIIQPINISTPLMKIYFGFASRSLLLLKSLLRYESIRCYLIYNMHFIELMIYMFQYFPNLTDQILTCLGAMIDTDIIIPEASLQRLVITIWKNLLDPTMVQKSKKTFEFYTTLILTCGSRMVSQQQRLDTGRHQRSKKQKGNDNGFVELDVNTCTSFCIMNEETLLDVRNDTWTFETIRSTFAVQKQNNNNNDNKFCYEIILKTDGLIQIGWMNALTQIDAEAGSGVGDDEHSYGYDGYRCKKWHGRHRVRKSSYGKSWALGDIITCAIDLDQGEIRYYQNGYDLGIAFTKVDTTKEWFPAASLSTGQGCEFLFGSPLDRLHYPPEGYRSIYDLLQLSTMDKEGSSTQLKQNSISELSMTMENLSLPDEDEEFDSFYSDTAKINEEDDNNSDYFDEDEDENNSSLNDQLMNDQPLLYIEMIIAHRQQKEKIETDDTDDNNSNMIIFGLKNAFTTMNNIELVYDHDKKKGTIYHAMTNLTPTSFSMNIEDGSILGLLYYHSTNQFGVSLNGTNLSLVHLPTGSSFLPYLPYVKGNVKTKTNFGQDPFYYSHQLNLLDLETKNMVDYLNLFF
ncbi:hypothetical protein BJ944DRAFT_290330 [Cunninghamella echinulata]|nr:hypothetical protein BJ944DRAFT_290330 [Cunninghamella echinulata]